MSFWDNVESVVRKLANGNDYSYNPSTDAYEILRKDGSMQTVQVDDFEEDRRKRK